MGMSVQIPLAYKIQNANRTKCFEVAIMTIPYSKRLTTQKKDKLE
jgi:hypothetical protein